MDINIKITENVNSELIDYINSIDGDNDNINDFLNTILEIGYSTYKHINRNSIVYTQNNISNDDNILNKIDKTINLNNDKIIQMIDDIKNNTNTISHLFNKSSIKGIYGENLITEIFTNYFPDYLITTTADISHSGDLHLFIPEINETILIENKFYTNSINQKEIDKLYYDMDNTGIKYSLFISLSSKIVNKKNDIEWEINNDKIIVYISNVLDNNNYIIIGLMILKTLIMFNKKNDQVVNIQNFSLNSHKKIIERFNSMNSLKTQIDKIKNTILNIHSSTSNQLLDLYNSMTILDNNFNQSLDLLQNSISDEFNSISNVIELPNINHIYNMVNNIDNINLKNILNIIVSDLYSKNFIIDNRWNILKNNIECGKIALLKNSVNINLKNNLVLKNIKKENWINIIYLLENC